MEQVSRWSAIGLPLGTLWALLHYNLYVAAWIFVGCVLVICVALIVAAWRLVGLPLTREE